jgi:hypothetical protein
MIGQIRALGCVRAGVRPAVAVVMLAGFMRVEQAWKSAQTATIVLAEFLGAELAVASIRCCFLLGVLRVGAIAMRLPQSCRDTPIFIGVAAFSLGLTTATALGALTISLLRTHTAYPAAVGGLLAFGAAALLWPWSFRWRESNFFRLWSAYRQTSWSPMTRAGRREQTATGRAQPLALSMAVLAALSIWVCGIVVVADRGALRLDVLFSFGVLAAAGLIMGGLDLGANAMGETRWRRGIQLMGAGVALTAGLGLAWELGRWPPPF